MKKELLLWTLLLFSISATGQNHLLGLWEGVITDGGIYTDQGFKFELYIQEINEQKITGRSYVHLSKEEIVEMDIEGLLYSDRSIYFKDISFVPLEGVPVKPPYNRKYQVIYNRSIWDSSLEGYWQEILPEAFHDKRQRGRIKLKKVETSKP